MPKRAREFTCLFKGVESKGHYGEYEVTFQPAETSIYMASPSGRPRRYREWKVTVRRRPIGHFSDLDQSYRLCIEARANRAAVVQAFEIEHSEYEMGKAK